jgi:hypothetical protein
VAGASSNARAIGFASRLRASVRSIGLGGGSNFSRACRLEFAVRLSSSIFGARARRPNQFAMSRPRLVPAQGSMALVARFQATWRFSLRAVEGSVDFRSPCSLRMGERRLLSGQRPDGASDGDASPSRVDQRDCPSAKLPPGLDGAHGGDGSAAARTNAVA